MMSWPDGWVWLFGLFVASVWSSGFEESPPSIKSSTLSSGFKEPPPNFSLRSMAEGPTRLPCCFRKEGEKVVQVSWSRERPDGSKEQIITAHYLDGHTEFGRFSGRVRFESSDATVDSALIILNTEESDEGTYTCHIATFPSGNFESQLSLHVWTKPISSLEPMELVEGQAFRVAATCRSVARPPPRLSWETDLAGQSQNHSSESGVVTAHFSLHPLRSMNGKQLDCLVWHPSQQHPHRLSNHLVVTFPPDPTVSGYDGQWYVGLEGAAVRCDSGGNPKPRSFTWTRRGGELPEGVSLANGTLFFNRPLMLTDTGVYECVAENSVGVGKADIEISVAEFAPRKTTFDNLMMIIVGVVVGTLLVVMVIAFVMVNRYHKRRNRKLEMELTEKKEEISTLSRQASFRRINSISTDPRILTQTDECIPLRVEGTIRTSLSSLGEQPRCRDSRSTLSGGRGTGAAGGVDFLGRPALFNASRRGERGREREGERDGSLRRTESFRRNNVSTDPYLHPPLHPSPPPFEQSADHLRPLNGNIIMPVGRDRNRLSPLGSGCRLLTREDQDGGQREQGSQSERREVEGHLDSDSNSSQTSEAIPNNFHYSNGTLRPKQVLNPSLIHPKGQIV